ncbi:unnamed protein product, partial [Scytosiphon promiscuus]
MLANTARARELAPGSSVTVYRSSVNFEMCPIPLTLPLEPLPFHSWGLTPITYFGPAPVSARWEGKLLLAPSSDNFQTLIRTQEDFRLLLGHNLVMNT